MFELWGPQSGAISVAAVPLEPAPRIPQLVDVGLIVLDNFEQRIRMIVDDSFYFLGASGEHNGVVFACIEQNVLHFLGFVLEPGSISGTACEVLHE